MGSNLQKSQALEGMVYGTNGTVTHASVKTKKTPVQAPMRLIWGLKSHMEAAQLKWKSFITQTSISNKGMWLKFVSPVIVNGTRNAKLDKIEVECQSQGWLYVVVVYVGGSKPNINLYYYSICQFSLEFEIGTYYIQAWWGILYY